MNLATIIQILGLVAILATSLANYLKTLETHKQIAALNSLAEGAFLGKK